MARIPFDIKFRPQIESGEYKVEIGEDNPWPARIVCWDLNGNDLIVIISNPGGREDGLIYTSDGRHNAYVPKVDSNLFIVTPEPELTEFEKALADVIGYAISQSVVEPNYETYKFVKDWSERLLDAAKKELCKGCAANLKGYIKGRHDALKEKEMEENRVYKYEGPTIPAFWPPCHYGGECTNPFHDCINCHRQSTDGISTTTGTSTAKLEG